MIPGPSTIAYLIGIIAGIIYYLDGWGPTPGKKEIASSRRYRGLATVIGGGVISPLLDRYLLETHRHDFFLGYLFGVVTGWLLLFTSGTILYTVWKNTKELNSETKAFHIGQICFSILEVISFGISEGPSIKQERERQSIEAETEFQKMRDKLKKENEKAYLEHEEKQISLDQKRVEIKREHLEDLKNSLIKANLEPDREMEKLIQQKDEAIGKLKEELVLAHKRYNEDQVRIHEVVKEYNKSIEMQQKLREELNLALKNFKKEIISKTDLARLVSYQKINQYESAGIRIVRRHVGAVQVKISNGEYLSYKLTVEGATPIFTFACKHRSLRSGKDFSDHPKSVYEWVWGKDDTDRDADDDTYGVAMSFLAATKYTLLVEHMSKDDNVIQVLMDIDYESQDPQDKFHEPLRVFSS